MNKWSTIKTAILTKLFLTESESQQEGYSEKMQYLANECLIRLANDFKANVKDVVFKLYDTLEDLSDAVSVDGAVLEDGIYLSDLGEYHVKNQRIQMPSDFISYENEIIYDGSIVSPRYIFIGRNTMIFKDPGEYTVIYNALYPEISFTDIINDTELYIDQTVLYTIPSYVASSLLADTDPQRSAILRNEFELLASRIDNTRMDNTTVFTSEGGWFWLRKQRILEITRKGNDFSFQVPSGTSGKDVEIGLALVLMRLAERENLTEEVFLRNLGGWIKCIKEQQ